MGQIPSQLHEFASAFWLLPVVSSAAEMCAYTAESNGSMTALYAIFSLGECLSLGGLDPVLKLGTAAEKASALVSKLGGAGAHAVSAAVSLGTKLKEGLGELVSGITKAANSLLDMMAGAGKLVPDGPSGSFHGTGGYTKYEAVGGSGSSGGSGASGSTTGKGVENNGPTQSGVVGDLDHSVPILGRGSTGRTEAKTLEEDLFMREVKANPLEGATNTGLEMKDERWLAADGWVKMQRVHYGMNNQKITIHYVYNTITKEFDDFKFTTG